MDRNDRRKRKYNQLIEAGYTPAEATKFKDLSNYKVIRLIEAREGIKEALDREFINLDNKVAMILKGKDYD